MERFKQTIVKLENDVADLRQFQKELKGSVPVKADIHYCTSSQEFGEYTLLDEIDTFRFMVICCPAGNNTYNYSYRLQNPTPELTAYLGVQEKRSGFCIEYIAVDIDNFETHCMKNNGTPFVLTDEIRKCLESKLWDFAVDALIRPGGSNYTQTNENLNKHIRQEFYTDITIPFTHTYTICPHVSFYITPISNMLDECTIHEITTKQVVFRIKYGNTPATYNKIFSTLKLHYMINGIAKQNDIDNLLD